MSSTQVESAGGMVVDVLAYWLHLFAISYLGIRLDLAESFRKTWLIHGSPLLGR